MADVSGTQDFARFELLTDEGKSAVDGFQDGLKIVGDLNAIDQYLKFPFPINGVKKKGLEANRLAPGDRVVLVGLGYVTDAALSGAVKPRKWLPNGDERYILMRAFGRPNRERPTEYEFAFVVRNWYIAEQ